MYVLPPRKLQRDRVEAEDGLAQKKKKRKRREMLAQQQKLRLAVDSLLWLLSWLKTEG